MGTGIGEAMLIGAATGAGTSALTGGDPLKGALFGLAGGALGPALGSALGGASAAPAVATGTTAGTTAATTAASATPALTSGAAVPAGSFGNVGMQTMGFGNTIGSLGAPTTAGATGTFGQIGASGFGGIPGMAADAGTAALGPVTTAAPAAVTPEAFAPKTGFMDVFKGGGEGDTRAFGKRLGDYLVQNPTQAAMSGSSLSNMLFNKPKVIMPDDEYDGPLKKFRYDPGTYRPSYMAQGGIADLPASRKYARGGDLGGYSDGGRMLKGPGDGMSDSIPARIGARQPARLADGEFVVPADVVSHLGNGSTDAGAKQLYAMMDKVRKARTGTKKQGREINPRKYVPA